MKHVEIAFNRLSDLTSTIRFPRSMEALIIESNEITSLQILDYIDAPSYFPCFVSHKSLRNLSLTNNPLIDSLPQRPHNLSVLNISETRISSWDYLSQLSPLLPHLTSLRVSTETFSKTRIFQGLQANRDNLPVELVNSLVIARFPNLTLLNGSKVPDGEKRLM